MFAHLLRTLSLNSNMKKVILLQRGDENHLESTQVANFTKDLFGGLRKKGLVVELKTRHACGRTELNDVFREKCQIDKYESSGK
jgi:hypothetical protein